MTPVATANGYRTTSASANLKSKLDNLHISTEAMVKSILFDGLRATGVELVDGRKGGPYQFKLAEIDVLTCAQSSQRKKLFSQRAPLTLPKFSCSQG